VGSREARWRRPAEALWALQFLGGLVSAPVYALLAVYVEASLHHPPILTASLRSWQLALGGVWAPLAGALADRLGYKRAYLWGMTSTVATCAVFLTGQPWALGVLMLYGGLLGSLQGTAGQAYLMAATRRSRLGRASAGYFLGNTLGTALGSHVAGGVARAWGFAPLGVASTALAAALMLGALLLLPPLARPKEEKAREPNMFAALPGMLTRPCLRLLLGIRFLPTCYWGAVTLLVPLLLFRLTRSDEVVGDYSGVSLALAAVFQLITGRVCDRTGVQLPLRLAPVGITASAVGLALGARSVAALWGFGILGACSAWSLSTTMPLLIDDVSGPGEKGRVVGLTFLAWSAGMLVGNMVAGRLATGRLGTTLPGLPFALGALCGLGTIALAAAIAHRITTVSASSSQDEKRPAAAETPGETVCVAVPGEGRPESRR
jgi:MFS family permease